MTKKKIDIGIGIFSSPISKSGITPMSNLVEIMFAISNNVYVVTGNEGYDFFKNDHRINTNGVDHKQGKTFISRIINYIILQIQLSYLFIKNSRKVDIWFFSIGADSLLLPLIVSKILNKKTVLILAGSSMQTLKHSGDNYYILFNIISKIACFLSNKIIVYSESLIQALGMQKYKQKITVAPRHFIDFNKFYMRIPYNQRKKIVGYIGRFSKEKGIENFIYAIPEILEKLNNISFILIGKGTLFNKIRTLSKDLNIENKVKIINWVPHNQIPNYLNKLKLLVLPSYTEGLPNIILESMACGTPVLATCVGGIPDIIKDEETGFLLQKNNSEFLVEKIVYILNYQKNDDIIKNGILTIQKKFNFNVAINRYKNIIESL